MLAQFPPSFIFSQIYFDPFGETSFYANPINGALKTAPYGHFESKRKSSKLFAIATAKKS